MLRGCRKKMIMLKNTGSSIFDEAYFILTDSAAQSDTLSDNDMVKEANRIIEGCSLPECEKPSKWKSALWFTAGALCSAAAYTLVLML